MTTKSIQQLREGLEDLDWQEFYSLCPKLLDRLESAEAQLDAIGIALEWPGQDDRTLLEVVKEAATWGVLRCQDRAELHRLRTAQQPRDMVDAPDNEHVLAHNGCTWIEAIKEDGRWVNAYNGHSFTPFYWLPLPDQSEVKS